MDLNLLDAYADLLEDKKIHSIAYYCDVIVKNLTCFADKPFLRKKFVVKRYSMDQLVIFFSYKKENFAITVTNDTNRIFCRLYEGYARCYAGRFDDCDYSSLTGMKIVGIIHKLKDLEDFLKKVVEIFVTIDHSNYIDAKPRENYTVSKK